MNVSHIKCVSMRDQVLTWEPEVLNFLTQRRPGHEFETLRDEEGAYAPTPKLQPPEDHHRVPGVGLLKGPRRKQFLMSE